MVYIGIHPLCGTVSYLGFAKCMKTCSHRYNIIQNSFMTLRFSVFYLFSSPYSPAQPLATADLSTFPVVFPFPEYHLVSSLKF